MSGKTAIEWIIVLFLAGILAGGSIYSLVEYRNAINDSNATSFINNLLNVFNIIPTWLKIMVIVGFAAGIGLIGLGIYKVFSRVSAKL